MTLAIATHAHSIAAGLSIAATQPATIANNDILLASVAKTTAASPSAPAGWALVTANGNFRSGMVADSNANSSLTGGTGHIDWYWKLAASESGTYSWTSTSATWDAVIMRITGFAGVKPGGLFLPCHLFVGSKVNTRVGTVISPPTKHPLCDIYADRVLMIHSFAQAVPAATAVFSALSGGPMTILYNTGQVGLTHLVAWEYIDLAVTPNFGKRQLTTDQSAGGSSGISLLLSDPSAITGIPTDKRNDLQAQAA